MVSQRFQTSIHWIDGDSCQVLLLWMTRCICNNIHANFSATISTFRLWPVSIAAATQIHSKAVTKIRLIHEALKQMKNYNLLNKFCFCSTKSCIKIMKYVEYRKIFWYSCFKRPKLQSSINPLLFNFKNTSPAPDVK